MRFSPGCGCCSPGEPCEFCDLTSKTPIFIGVTGFVDEENCIIPDCPKPFSCLNDTYEFDVGDGDPALYPVGSTETGGWFYFDCAEGGGYGSGCDTYKSVSIMCTDLSPSIWDDGASGWYIQLFCYILLFGGIRFYLGAWICRVLESDIDEVNSCDPLDIEITEVYRFWDCGGVVDPPVLEAGITISITA